MNAPVKNPAPFDLEQAIEAVTIFASLAADQQQEVLRRMRAIAAGRPDPGPSVEV